MALVERKLQKIAFEKSIPAGSAEIFELTASKNQQFVLLTIDVKDANLNRVSGLLVTVSRLIGTIEQIVNPVIDSKFFPIKLGDIIYGIRGIPAEKEAPKEGLIIPETGTLRIKLHNTTSSAITATVTVEYIDELYS